MTSEPLVPRRTVYLVLFAVYTAIGVLLTFYRYLEDVANHHMGMFVARGIDEMTGAYTALVAVPIAVWAARRFPISRTTWTTGVPAAFLAAIVYSVIHTTLMWVTRLVLYPMLGQGSYDYGIMLFRYPMEASNDLVSFAFVSAFVYAWWSLAAARRSELAAEQLQTELARAQLENLRLQLNPHFLFNTLNAISSVMYEDVARADEMLAKLSDFLRVVLASNGVHQVPIDEELDVERKYLDIMTTRLERAFAFDVKVDEGSKDAVVPFMILQPLLENSIKHGASRERDELEIAVRVRRSGDSTVISVADDGAGYDAPAGGGGNGLRIVRSRLEHMYGSGASLAVGPRDGGGTEAIVTVPYLAAGGAA